MSAVFCLAEMLNLGVCALCRVRNVAHSVTGHAASRFATAIRRHGPPVCWLVVFSPPFLFVGALLGAWGRDSMGHGLVALLSIIWLFTLPPLAAELLRLLTRPTARSLFAPNDAPLSKTEECVVSVSLGVVLLAEFVALANVH